MNIREFIEYFERNIPDASESRVHNPEAPATGEEINEALARFSNTID